MKKFQKIVLCVASVYVLAVIGATVYAQTGYINNLPAGTLGRAEEGLIPLSSFTPDADGGWKLNTVEQQDGPWGKKYVVKQVKVTRCLQENGAYMRVYETELLEKPFVDTTTAEFLYDGMEVRLERG